MRKSLLSFALAAKKMTVEEFVTTYPDHVLVVEPYTALGDTGFQTQPIKVGDGVQEESGITVAPICKRPGANAFMSMVTVGRAGNNDIQLKVAQVSKFHAYFLLKDEGVVELVDAGSTFGTFLSGRKLTPKERVPLESGVGVRVASLNVTYYDARGFYECLQAANQYGTEE